MLLLTVFSFSSANRPNTRHRDDNVDATTQKRALWLPRASSRRRTRDTWPCSPCARYCAAFGVGGYLHGTTEGMLGSGFMMIQVWDMGVPTTVSRENMSPAAERVLFRSAAQIPTAVMLAFSDASFNLLYQVLYFT